MFSISFESLRKWLFAVVVITWLLKACLFCRKPRLSWNSPSSRPSRGCSFIVGPTRLSSRLLTILFCHSFGRSSSSCIFTAQDRNMGMVPRVVVSFCESVPTFALLCSSVFSHCGMGVRVIVWLGASLLSCFTSIRLDLFWVQGILWPLSLYHPPYPVWWRQHPGTLQV